MSMDSGVSSAALAVEAITTALADAGLETTDVDGLVTYEADPTSPFLMSQLLGLGALNWYSTTMSGGGGACATFQDAALAVSTGQCSHVVVYRAENLRSGRRFGQGISDADAGSSQPLLRQVRTYGSITPAWWQAPSFHRYLHDHGKTNGDLAHVVVSARKWAESNPAARFYGRPFTVDDHQASKWVAEPVLRVNDCCLESDGGAAFVVTSADRARDLRSTPVAIGAVARGMAHRSTLMQNYYGDDTDGLPDLDVVAANLYRQRGLSAHDFDAAIIYDSFSPLVPMSLEALGFCGRGEGIDFIADGHTSPGGRHPVNPNGGQIGEGYLHGFNGIVEAVRQIRGVAVNQLPAANTVMITSGPALPTSAMVLQAC
ncbi:lipid-transfer protein [Mycobacterium sp. MBM]|nr:lipid-transfer protein [Mycobacterium sp. MBM]